MTEESSEILRSAQNDIGSFPVPVGSTDLAEKPSFFSVLSGPRPDS
jgi:hypothetical protein